ncbi:small and basic intrinsic protein 1A [Hibiscus trionum]|uniref:Small and basic intrinsic protein 1A n=1 Tax=Hibiscus trionum TaxID=183268 RepID=A0A9W7MI87_HIBTR|nr:small and basic intrinsic protein 1A [Hibiscus trionum]
MGLVKSAMADALLTSMWIFTMPFLRIFTLQISASLGVQALPMAAFFITTVLVTLIMFIFTLIGNALGGASFNPTASLAFYAAGLKKDMSPLAIAVRFPAQAAGGVVGVKAILGVLPRELTETMKGPSLKVDLQTGFLAEGLLTFGLCLALLVILFRGPKNPLVKLLLMAATTVGCVGTGAKYTGPSMNPANAFGWAYVNNWHNSWELYYVYWLGPLTGATVAAWVFRFLLSPSPASNKEKKA